MKKLIPITIITGFLGSGKTTLLNNILKQNKGYKIAIVVNEFGNINLESQLVEKQNEGIVELSNGCVCCVARGEMISTLDEIMEKYPDTEYIIVEASGLSDPVSLSLTLYNPSLRDRFRLDSIICVVDFLNFEEALDKYDITRKQISDSNIVVITKYKENKEELNQLKELIEGLNPKARIYIDNEGFNPLELLDQSLTDFKDLEDLEKEKEHIHKHEDFEHYIFQSSKELNYDSFEEFIQNLDNSVIRLKGFVNFSNAPHKNKKYLLQYVVGSKDYRVVDWENQEKTSALLFIGKKLDRKPIESQLENCLMD